ncbi:MAG: hypothetical protein KIS66_06165 [Fimbriimonadaceae bacterium]|nr:hypothetical protein [Fimbriimonadaceae bacterium]
MKWFEELRAKRNTWHEANVANEFEDPLRHLMVDKYANPSHFIYELLQNAEDQGATEASFELSPTCLTFRHNGTEFTERDVRSITGVGMSFKPNEPNKIGRFGIGFKSVFAITSRPEIYTTLEGNSFAFAIEHLVVPNPIEHTPHLKEGWTTFILPLLPEEKLGLHQIISERLQNLGADTMLFLRHLSWIEWQDGNRQGSYLCNRQEGGTVDLEEQVTASGSSPRTLKKRYLKYSDEVHIDGADRHLEVSIAFLLEDGAIKPETGQSTLNVFFPTRELTHLRFRLHGPFLLNDGRANLREGSEENRQLMEACARLLANTLPKLRDRGLLSPSCLDALPIRPSDFDGSAFRPLYDATLRALVTEALIPTDDGQHAPAAQAKLSDSQPLRNLLGSPQLSALFGHPDGGPHQIRWVSADIQKNAVASKEIYDYLMRHVRVEEVDADKFAARIDGEFLSVQSDDWMCSFYELLDNQQSLWRAKAGYQPQGVLRGKPIIRTESGAHIPPFREDGTPRVYMPSGIGAPERTVRKNVAANETARSFLIKLGLEVRSSTDEVLEVILPRIQRYDVEACLAAYTSFLPGYLDDLAIIRSAIERCSTARTGQLRTALLNTPFVLAYNAEDDSKLSLRRPQEVKVPTQELAFWFAGDPEVWFVSGDLLEEEVWEHISTFLNAGRQAVLDTVAPVYRSANHDGHVTLANEWGDHRRGLHRFDPGATIPGLEFALANINEERARFLWNLLLSSSHLIRGMVEVSSRQSFENSRISERRSPIGDLCMSSAWLPDHSQTWHSPDEVSLEDLPEGFEVTSPQAEALAAALGFKNAGEREALRHLGIPAEDAWVIRSLAQNPALYLRIKAELARDAARVSFPTSSIPDIGRLAQVVEEEAHNAPEITYEVKSRSVRTSSPIAQDSRTYLASRYTDDDEELRCQACEQPMPFRLDDGSPYFEAIQFLHLVRQELYQNRLALCPVCAAKFQHAIGSSDEEIFAQFMSLSAEFTTMPVVLARAASTIRFNPRHIVELQMAVRAVLEGGS